VGWANCALARLCSAFLLGFRAGSCVGCACVPVLVLGDARPL